MDKNCKSDYYTEYLSYTYTIIQQLVNLRPPVLSQSDMAKHANVSLRTIQRFEAYQLKNNSYLIWVYKKILQN